MSKKRNRHFQQTSTPAVQSSDISADEPVAVAAEEEEDVTSDRTEEEENDDAIGVYVEDTPPEEETDTEAVDVDQADAPVDELDDPVSEDIPEVKQVKPASKAEDLLPSRPAAYARRGTPVPDHTAYGKKLIKLFDAYRARMSSKTVVSRQEVISRISMLQGIVDYACPLRPLDTATAKDVVRIVFDEFSANYGTIYKLSNLFQGDQMLRTAKDADRVNCFVMAFVQLVDAVRGTTNRIMFNMDRFASTMRNQSFVTAVTKLRTGIERRLSYKE